MTRIIAALARIAAAFAFEFRREYRRQAELQESIEQPAFTHRPLFGGAYDPSMAVVNDFIIRDALYRALRKHSPNEPPYEA